MIIDIHAHIGLSQDGGHGKLDILLENMDQCHIDRTVLFATDEDNKGETFEHLNSKIIQAKDQYPDKFIAFARIIPSAGQKAVDEFNRCCKRGIKGLKLKPADGFKPQEATNLFDIIKDRTDFPVIIHTAHQPPSHPDLWEPFFKEYPKINFILAHGGKDRYRACADVVEKYDNAYLDTTTLSYQRTGYLYKRLGADKILFGSDYPYSHPAIELKKYELLIKDKSDLEKILHANAAQLLGFPE